MCACSTLRCQKGTVDPVDLELLTLVSCHVDLGNPAWVLPKSSQYYLPAQVLLQFPVFV